MYDFGVNHIMLKRPQKRINGNMMGNILRGYEIPYMTVAYYFVLYFRRSVYWDNDLAKDWDNIEPTKNGTKLAVFLFIK